MAAPQFSQNTGLGGGAGGGVGTTTGSGGGVGAGASFVPQAQQKRASSAFSLSHCGQRIMALRKVPENEAPPQPGLM